MSEWAKKHAPVDLVYANKVENVPPPPTYGQKHTHGAMVATEPICMDVDSDNMLNLALSIKPPGESTYVAVIMFQWYLDVHTGMTSNCHFSACYMSSRLYLCSPKSQITNASCDSKIWTVNNTFCPQTLDLSRAQGITPPLKMKTFLFSGKKQMEDTSGRDEGSLTQGQNRYRPTIQITMTKYGTRVDNNAWTM